MDGQSVRFSAPVLHGRQGSGAGPETLLISAVTATTPAPSRLPAETTAAIQRDISENRRGGHRCPAVHDTYARIIVSPVFRGADAARQEEYQAAAIEARDHCFIGQTVAAGGTAYEVGAVTLA